jgi:hypothetical protein
MGDGDKAERHVAHALECGVIGEVAVAQHHCFASVDLPNAAGCAPAGIQT